MSKLAAASLIVACASPLASQTSENGDQSAPPIPERVGFWVTNDDYPQDKILSKIRGAVRVVLAVDATGKIYRRDIALSSREPKLDELSCNLVRRRGHYIPAKDTDGAPVSSEISRGVIWDIPNEVPKVNRLVKYDAIVQVQRLPQKRPYIEIVIREIISADGKRENCVLQEGSGIASFDRQACQLVTAAGHLPPLRALDNQDIRGVRVRSIAFVAEESARK